MKFGEYHHITINELAKEINDDNKTSLGAIPLFESPVLHEAPYFDKLNDIKINYPFALERIQDSEFIENVMIDNVRYGLFRKLFKGHVFDFLINGEQGHEQMSAFIKYDSKADVMQIKGLWQIDFVLGLVRGLITDYYSKQYSMLESDSIANNKGKKFFHTLAKDFLSKGKRVEVIIKGKQVPYEIEQAEAYWRRSSDTSAEKIILHTFA